MIVIKPYSELKVPMFVNKIYLDFETPTSLY